MRPIACFVLLACLLVPLVQADPTPGVGFQAMPPHPRLKEAIERGEVSLPRFMTDPDLAHTMGVDRPQSRVQALTGSINVLAVLVDFSDKGHTVNATFFDNLIFAAPIAGARGSARDYYDEISYGVVDIVTVDLPSSLGWQQRPWPYTYSYYVNNQYCTDGLYPHNCQRLAEDIVDAINSVVDFSDYDNDGDRVAEPIMLIHAGKGAEFTGDTTDIWSHSGALAFPRTCDGVTIADYAIMPEYWYSANDMTIGVFVHEMGHSFWGLPDLYDRDYTSEGVGAWSLMGSGSWNGPSSDGSSPAWPDAWSRIQMGFSTSTLVTSNIPGATIRRALTNPDAIFRLDSDTLGYQEYFLVENRQRVSGTYDQYLPGAGLLIWHVDEAMNRPDRQNDYECTSEPHCLCTDDRHYLLALEQADGDRDLERNVNGGDDGDPFPGNLAAPNRRWTMTTHPESSSWYGSGPTCANTCIGVRGISNSGAPMTADLQVACDPLWDYQYIYLPLVRKNSGSSINGDFEAGATGWTTYSLMSRPIIVNSGFSPGVTPHSGSWAAWLGGDNNETAYIEQQVTVPPAAPYLSYYHWIDSVDICGFDWASVYIDSQVVDQYALCVTANTSGWVKHTVSLGDYAGQSVKLQIRVQTDSGLYSSLFIDDVSFAAGAATTSARTTAAAGRAMRQPDSYQSRQVERETSQRSRHAEHRLDTWIEK